MEKIHHADRNCKKAEVTILISVKLNKQNPEKWLEMKDILE